MSGGLSAFSDHAGLCGAARGNRETIVVGDVHKDPRYLPTFGSTQSEIVVPIIDEHNHVVGILDVESEKLNAFARKIASFSSARHFCYRARCRVALNGAPRSSGARVVVADGPRCIGQILIEKQGRICSFAIVMMMAARI